MNSSRQSTQTGSMPPIAARKSEGIGGEGIGIPLSVVLSGATAPLLLLLVAGNAIAHLSQEVGQLSEEVFRGDRLPVLKFPNPSEANSSD